MKCGEVEAKNLGKACRPTSQWSGRFRAARYSAAQRRVRRFEIGSMSSSRTAGFLLLFAAAIPIAIWAILLLVSPPSGMSTWKAVTTTALGLLTEESPNNWFFVALVALALALLGLAITYLSISLPTKSVATTLLCCNLITLAASALWGPSHLTFFVAVPLWWGWKCVREASMSNPAIGA